uniref:Granulin b n=1 Tax=Cyprinus carpio TaxID=7962 RepID=A0A8C1VA43_CYPCA
YVCLQAECCSDHLHCCYQGTLCDLVHSKCVNKTHILDWVEKVATKQQAVICPDQESEGPDDTTCCQMPDGSWGCCPMKDAVCCEDKQHCCPQGTKCDLEHSRCVSATYGPSPLWRKFAARRRKAVAPPKDSGHIRDVICPDDIYTCPDDTTCCKLDNGSYGCCPMPKAVCCSDHVHCCPEATTCDLVHSMCVSANGFVVKMATKIPATSLKPKDKVVPCNETVACASGTTCCKTQEGTWACCPLPKVFKLSAVCCEDHFHCCPEDTVCNLAAGTCDDPADLSVSVPWMAKEPTFPIASSNQKCDETTSCPDGSTCCRLSSGKWGCCPLPQVNNTSLSYLNMKIQSAHTHRERTHREHTPGAVGSHLCCGARCLCSIMNARLTLYHFLSLKAVCCKDGDHCCPNGYTCNEKKTSCYKASHEIPWFTKQEARVLKGSEVLFGDEDVKCDSTTSCASGSTCCKLPTGQWGCCPLVKAVCCEDHEHCCPQGYTCDLEFGTCVKASGLHSVLLTRLQTHTDTRPEEEVLCDASTRCSKTQSCCRLSDSTWACCPYKEAVCCEDMKHCCPVGYRCDPEVQGCTKVSTSMWWENAL